MQYLHATFDNISSESETARVELAELVRAKLRKGSMFTFRLILTWHVTF